MRAPLAPPQPFALTLSDGYRVRGRLWVPDRPRTVAVVYLHGIQSHGGWYEWSASVLADAGLPVLLADRRGSGLNGEARGDVPAMERWFLDLDELATWMIDAHGVRRVALVGVSWGGKLAAAWAARNAQRTAALLLVAPGLFPAVRFGALRRAGVALALLRRPTRRFPIPLSDPALFTDSPEGRSFIRDDALKLERVTARFLLGSARLDRMLVRRPAGPSAVPATLMLAGRDRIIRNEPTERWARATFGPALRVVRFESAAHTIELEPDVSGFEAALRRWSAELRA